MPHQWIEGNLPVASKCAICDKTCGSVLRLQDWRCLWCRFTVHATCRPGWRARCPLPPWRVSLVPPTALHAAEGDAFQPARPPHASPLLVFVNSKSGDNQGVKFLRRFKQLLNPAQVFDLTAGGGPAPGLRLFRHLDPFRVLVCSGDGSVGWVLAEIDSLNMHKQCQVAVLPLGTGNDLARVLGWGAACDDDAHLPLLLERYEQASAKMLDRWSIMAFERPLGSGTGGGTSERAARQSAIEEAVNSHLDAITHSAELGVVCSASTESLREIVMEAAGAGSVGSERERAARARLMSLLDALLDAIHSNTGAQVRSNSTSSTIEKGQRDKTEKEEVNQRARMAGNRGAEVRRRADSLRRAVVAALGPPQDTLKVSACESRGSWELLPAPKQFADGSRRSSAASDAGPPPGDSIPDVDEEIARLFPLCIGQQQGKSSEHHTPIANSPHMLGLCNPIVSSNMLGLLPNLELVNSNSCTNLLKLRDEGSRDVSEISLFRVPSLIISNTASPSDLEEDFQRGETYESDKMTIIDTDAPYNDDMQFRNDGNDLSPNKRLSGESPMKRNRSPESEKDLSDVLSAMSNEECSLGSGIEEKTDNSGVNNDIEDVNERICHIDSPETSDTTCPNSETIHGESMLDDMSSVLGQDLILAMMGKNGDIESTFTDETTLFTSDTTSEIPLDSRNPSLEKYDDRIFNFLQKARKSAKDGTGEEKFGFENKVFNLAAPTEPVKYCSLAQFVEGNDIARKSFRKHLRHSKKMEKSENGVGKQAVLNEEVESCDTKPDVIRESCSIISSSVGAESVILNKDNSGLLMTRLKEDFDSDLNALKVESIDYEIGPELKIPERTRIDFEDSITLKKNSLGFDIGNEDMPEGVMPRTFPRVSVVVEPPSPSGSSSGGGGNGNGVTTIGLAPIWARERRCSDNGPRSMLDVERCSSATRRISCGSLFQPGEADRLSKSASSLWGGSGIAGINKSVESSVGSRRPLPIINPLVRLPAWPHVSGGLVGRCLLANADALCAAVSPLMDPQETLLEGFYERAVMNNYFGIGIDAKISLDFHQKREEHPEKCRSRARNYMWYGVLGSREWLQRTYRHLGQRVQLECDGQRIPLPELQGIVVLNIPSFMGGTNFWGGDAGGPFLPPSFDDRVLEVVAVFGSAQMAASRLINLQRHRIAQCRNVQINILGSEGVPVQVDGEAWLQPPGMIRIMHKNRAQVLCRSRALETSLKTWGEKQQKLCTGLPPSSHLEAATPSDELPPAELAQLLVFIETANTLVKWVKMSSITASGCGGPGSISGGGGLYARACEASSAVDALTPDGRLLPADKLRAHLGSLARILAELCTAAESLGVSGGGPSLQQAIRAARQQLALVRDQGGLASLQPPDSETEQSRSRRGWLRGAANRRASSSAGLNAASNMACAGGIPVSKWGLTEVGNWLVSLQLSEHTDAFAKNDVTGRELITLARRDLRDLGVTKVGHIKRILQGIKELQ